MPEEADTEKSGKEESFLQRIAGIAVGMGLVFSLFILWLPLRRQLLTPFLPRSTLDTLACWGEGGCHESESKPAAGIQPD